MANTKGEFDINELNKNLNAAIEKRRLRVWMSVSVPVPVPVSGPVSVSVSVPGALRREGRRPKSVSKKG